jgi:hypothetical protein
MEVAMSVFWHWPRPLPLFAFLAALALPLAVPAQEGPLRLPSNPGQQPSQTSDGNQVAPGIGGDAHTPFIVQSLILNGESSLQLSPGKMYFYGLVTGGARPTGPFSDGQFVKAVDYAGQLSAALAYGTSDTNSYLTQTAYHAIGGVSVDGSWDSFNAFYGSNQRSGATSASAKFSVSMDSLVIVIAIASSQQSITLDGVPGLEVDTENNGPGAEAMVIAHAFLRPGDYKVSESSGPMAAGQYHGMMADLIGVFVLGSNPPPPAAAKTASTAKTEDTASTVQSTQSGVSTADTHANQNSNSQNQNSAQDQNSARDQNSGQAQSPLAPATVSLFPICADEFQIEVNGVARPGDRTAGSGTFSWDWGDGTSSVSHFPAAHVYSDAGRYVVTIMATWEDGESISTSKFTTVGPGILQNCKALTIDARPGGSVTYGSPRAPDSQGNCEALCADIPPDHFVIVENVVGARASIIAVPENGFAFSGWSASGGITGMDGVPLDSTSPSISAVVHSDAHIWANFTKSTASSNTKPTPSQ